MRLRLATADRAEKACEKNDARTGITSANRAEEEEAERGVSFARREALERGERFGTIAGRRDARAGAIAATRRARPRAGAIDDPATRRIRIGVEGYERARAMRARAFASSTSPHQRDLAARIPRRMDARAHLLRDDVRPLGGDLRGDREVGERAREGGGRGHHF